MKSLIVAIAILALSACGAPPMAEELAPFARQFEKLAAERGLEVEASPMILDDKKNFEGSAIGRCERGYIRISKQYFESQTDNAVLRLVLHEQGHCALGLKHYGKNEIMSEVARGGSHFKNNREALLDRYFKDLN
jgi:hypothetical protein